jgi:hypothetical protein
MRNAYNRQKIKKCFKKKMELLLFHQTLDESTIHVAPPPPNTDEEDQPQETQKRRRGRPKTIKTEEELLEEEQNKKTRGRPQGSFKLEGKVTTEDKIFFFQHYYIEK